jgi:carbamoyl-phosphate synthase large subunit
MVRTGKPPTILVSGLHRGESPQSGGAVIESVRAVLPEARFVGLSYDIMESGLYARGPDAVDCAWLFPYPGAGPAAFLERLREVHAAEGLSLIIPTLDTEIEPLIRSRDELERMGIAVAVPSLRALHGRDKTALGALGQATDVPTPRTASGSTAAELAYRAATDIGYPCYVKGALYDAKLVHTEAQLYQAFAEIAAVWGTPVLLQQPIYGEEYVVAGVGDGAGGLVTHCALRKLLRTKLGKAYGGVSVDDPVVLDQTRRIIRELSWSGGFEVEFVKGADGRLYLFEINPRFPAWISFPSKVGCNMPGYVALRALGLDGAPPPPVPPGKMFFRHNADIIGDIGQLADFATTTIHHPADHGRSDGS